MTGPGAASTGTDHTCHATGCRVHVPPAMFMCKRHWFMVPRAMRDAIWDTYVPGQEIRKDPSDEYLKAAQRAIAAVELKESAS
jgi:hypothetical protein